MAGDRHRYPVVTHVIVWRREEFAMLRRSATGFMDGYYSLPGGHQQLGESVGEAARRECREELGVHVLELTPCCVLPYRSGSHQGVNFVFASHRYAGVPRIAEPELFDHLVWASPDRLPQPVPEWVPVALAMAAEGTWYRELEWD